MATTTTIERFANNVRTLRKKKFLTVSEACRVTGLSVPRWYRIEQGRYPGIMDAILVDQLAAAFGVRPEELLAESNGKDSNDGIITEKERRTRRPRAVTKSRRGGSRSRKRKNRRG